MLTLLILLLHYYALNATEVRWIPNTENEDNEPAKTAPRSQKYWDEHNIKRPDYAKTDLEFAQDHGLPTTQWYPNIYISMIIIGLALGLATGLYVKLKLTDSRNNNSGVRLGSEAEYFSRSSEKEALLDQTRQARLSRFAGNAGEAKLD